MNVQTISPQRLLSICNAGKAEIVDVRTPVEFRELHLAMARNVPLDKLDPTELMHGRNGAKDEPLYIICRTGSRGQRACQKFLEAGFSNVFNIEGGTLACVEAGLPI